VPERDWENLPRYGREKKIRGMTANVRRRSYSKFMRTHHRLKALLGYKRSNEIVARQFRQTDLVKQVHCLIFFWGETVGRGRQERVGLWQCGWVRAGWSQFGLWGVLGGGMAYGGCECSRGCRGSGAGGGWNGWIVMFVGVLVVGGVGLGGVGFVGGGGGGGVGSAGEMVWGVGVGR